MKLLFAFLFSFAVFNALASTPIQNNRTIEGSVTAYESIDINDKYHHVVDIGFFYTADLLEAIGHKGIDDYIEAQVNAANQVFDNSNLNIRRRVAYVGSFSTGYNPT